MQLVALPPDRIADAWRHIVQFAKQIAHRFPDEWPVRVIQEAAGARELQLWVIWDEAEQKAWGCVGTRIITKPSGLKVLDIAWMAGSKRERWMHLLPVLEAYGKAEGCDVVSFAGRFGWGPDLPGYRVKRMAIYEKQLVQARQQEAA